MSEVHRFQRNYEETTGDVETETGYKDVLQIPRAQQIRLVFDAPRHTRIMKETNIVKPFKAHIGL